MCHLLKTNKQTNKQEKLVDQQEFGQRYPMQRERNCNANVTENSMKQTTNNMQPTNKQNISIGGSFEQIREKHFGRQQVQTICNYSC